MSAEQSLASVVKDMNSNESLDEEVNLCQHILGNGTAKFGHFEKIMSPLTPPKVSRPRLHCPVLMDVLSIPPPDN